MQKAESLQRTGSFKYRGALNKILSLGEKGRARGVVTYSVGNHGHAVSAGAKLFGCPATIVLPSNAVPNKVANCKWWGAETIFYDPASERREDVASDLIEKRGLAFIPPFDDEFVMAGQGTTGLEACKQLKERSVMPDVVLVNTAAVWLPVSSRPSSISIRTPNVTSSNSTATRRWRPLSLLANLSASQLPTRQSWME
ncbi:threonine dehydratase [Sinorhizobium fredii]|nr:hypothetical protein AB395_00006260 [Sinorhizobium fredii CCBAU 45436]